MVDKRSGGIEVGVQFSDIESGSTEKRKSGYSLSHLSFGSFFFPNWLAGVP